MAIGPDFPPTYVPGVSYDTDSSFREDEHSVSKTRLVAAVAFGSAAVGFTVAAIVFSAVWLMIPALVCVMVSLGLALSLIPFGSGSCEGDTTTVCHDIRSRPRHTETIILTGSPSTTYVDTRPGSAFGWGGVHRSHPVSRPVHVSAPARGAPLPSLRSDDRQPNPLRGGGEVRGHGHGGGVLFNRR